MKTEKEIEKEINRLDEDITTLYNKLNKVTNKNDKKQIQISIYTLSSKIIALKWVL